MVYEVKKGDKGGVVVTSLIDPEHRFLAMAPQAAAAASHPVECRVPGHPTGIRHPPFDS